MATTATKFALLAGLVAVETATASRLTVGFNDGWEFSRDKAEWREVDVPHDWAIENDFEKKNYLPAVLLEGHLEARDDSFLPRGEGLYRKHLFLPPEAQGQHIKTSGRRIKKPIPVNFNLHNVLYLLFAAPKRFTPQVHPP